MDFDLIVKGGTVATAADTFESDIAIRDGRIVALGHDLGSADRDIDAGGMLVLPGGIDAHCHIEQESSTRLMTADDFYSGYVSAAKRTASRPQPSDGLILGLQGANE